VGVAVLRWGGFGEDGVGVLGPGEGLAAVVSGVDVDADGGFEVGDRGEVPRRRPWGVRIAKNTSTRLSQDPDVG
jgi:hypothetical protein